MYYMKYAEGCVCVLCVLCVLMLLLLTSGTACGLIIFHKILFCFRIIFDCSFEIYPSSKKSPQHTDNIMQRTTTTQHTQHKMQHTTQKQKRRCQVEHRDEIR